MTVVKLISLVLLLVYALFAAHPHEGKNPRLPLTQVSINPNAGSEVATSKCRAIHINPNDPQAYLPDPTCTPGVTNPKVTQANINDTICSHGFTKTIRPVVTYTDNLKRIQIQEYGYTDTNPKDYEEDHFIPLELGGNPSDPRNLWPEPHPSTNEKDLVEVYLNKQVCIGAMSLTDAQNEITHNWYTIYRQIQ